jgi:hypothetical protein
MSLSVKSRPWSEIAEHYRDLVEHDWDMRPMLRLVEQMTASDYATGIHATTSVSTLCIAQTAEFEFDKEMLRVYLRQGRFIFEYRESPYSINTWKKECENDQGFETFQHVVSQLGWFLK